MGGLFICLGVGVLLLILFFPIYLEANFYYRIQDKKAGFSVYLFKYFKIIGGYIDDYPGGFALHTSSDKATIMPVRDKEGRKKRVSVFKRFKATDFAIVTETGAEYLPLAMAFNIVCKSYFRYQGGDMQKFQSQLWLRQGKTLSLTANGVARFNLFMQICAFIKNLKEKMSHGK